MCMSTKIVLLFVPYYYLKKQQQKTKQNNKNTFTVHIKPLQKDIKNTPYLLFPNTYGVSLTVMEGWLEQ